MGMIGVEGECVKFGVGWGGGGCVGDDGRKRGWGLGGFAPPSARGQALGGMGGGGVGVRGWGGMGMDVRVWVGLTERGDGGYVGSRLRGNDENRGGRE